jgi:MFS family permease
MWAPAWNWVLVANALLGISQGLTWSTTVIMKIDLVGPRQRGLAMGLNEFAGYLAVAAAAFATGWVAARTGLRPEPFYLGVGFVGAGLLLSLLVRDTSRHAVLESDSTQATLARAVRLGDAAASRHPVDEASARYARLPDAPARQGALCDAAARHAPGAVLWRTTFGDRNLSSATQAGLVNNLNDGMAWGLFPLLFAAQGMSFRQIGVLAAIYPGTWGVLQIASGALSDYLGRKWLIASGMWIQALGIVLVSVSGTFAGFATGASLLGVGTAMVYPTLLAVVGDVAGPAWRASAVGGYRLWRDLGYAAGALLAGAAADLFGLAGAMWIVAALTFGSGVVSAVRMTETRPQLALGARLRAGARVTAV